MIITIIHLCMFVCSLARPIRLTNSISILAKLSSCQKKKIEKKTFVHCCGASQSFGLILNHGMYNHQIIHI